jgi:hypothetical protein
MQLTLPARHRWSLAWSPSALARSAAAVAMVGAAYLASAWYAGIAPFPPRDAPPYSRDAVLRAIPFDTPLPYDRTLIETAHGSPLAYHVVFSSPRTPDEVAAQVLDHLAGSPKWQLTENRPLTGEFTTHLARLSADGQMTHFAEIAVRRERSGSIIVFDFTPIPTTLAPK